MATFVLNDESVVNSYGFRIPNKGINLNRFRANPVMLDQHNNSTAGVIGKWVNIRIQGRQLLADADFDTADPKAAEIKGKVDRGYLKGASMGVTFDKSKMKLAADGIPDLSECEKYESSICAVPSSASALRLYVAATGELMSEAEIKMNLSGFTKKSELKITNMDLLKAIIHLLQLTADATADDVVKAITDMKQTSEQAAKETLKNALDDAQVDGRILGIMRADFEEMGKLNLSRTINILNSLPKAKKLGDVINTNVNGEKENRGKWTLDDYREKDPDALKKDPALYETLRLQAGMKNEV